MPLLKFRSSLFAGVLAAIGAPVMAVAPVLTSVLTCPQCGHARPEVMPTDACQFFYECERCHAVLRPKAGDCCVFCSYGSVPCPPVQMQRGCCCGGA
jgi:hypothetical protein